MEKHPLFEHPVEEASAFTAASLVATVRELRRLPHTRVPDVCVLEFDGDLTDALRRDGVAVDHDTWACFHTGMSRICVDGHDVGIVARTIGGPYAVLVAEQLLVSGARVILGLTSAGRVQASLALPSFVVADEAIRDEGTSLHYMPASQTVRGDEALVDALERELAKASLPVARGLVWTTDAPYRETRERIAAHAREGALAVEMQAASLFAFAAARGARVGVVAHVTNAIEAQDDAFHKGSADEDVRALYAMCRAAYALLAT